MVARMIRFYLRNLCLLALAALIALMPGAQAQFPGYPPANTVQIGNGPSAPPSWTFTLGSMASQQNSAVNITGGTITGMPAPLSGTDVANKTYVDQSAAGLSPHASVRLATTTALTPSATYANGAAGVGATLQGTTPGVLQVDGVNVALNDRILVKNEGTAANNGIYTVTTVGTGLVAFVLTRATDANTIGSGASAISTGTYVFTIAGATLLNTAWVQTASLSAIGTSDIIWQLFSAGAVSSLNSIAGPLNIVGDAATGISVGTASPNITIHGTSPVIPFYLAGCILANDATTPFTVLDISPCVATDSTNAVMANVSTAFTKTISGSWAAGSGHGGMGNGLTVAASQWYHVCMANNGGTPDYYFDSLATCANRPTLITDTKVRRIGSFYVNSSNHIYSFQQINDDVYFTANANFVGVSYPPGTGAVDYLVTNLSLGLGVPGVPTGISVVPHIYGRCVAGGTSPGGSGCNTYLGTAYTGAAPSNFSSFYIIQTECEINVGCQQAWAGDGPPTNTLGQIYFHTAFVGSAQGFAFAVNSYRDSRGKNGQ
jgi:hypothetical protein